MKRTWTVIITVMVVLLVGGGIWFGVSKHRAAATAPAPADDADKGTATVTTTPIASGSVSELMTAYGNVTAEPGEISVLPAPVESRVRELRVSGGQLVIKGAPVLEIEPSPDAKLQLIEAKNAVVAAERDAGSTKQRFDMKLATTAENQQAQQAVEAAKLKLDDLTRRGAGEETRAITAPFDGIVAKVDVQEGQLVPAGGPLVEIIPRGQIEVRLGIEPSQIGSVEVGQAVQLFAGNSDEGIAGEVRLVTHRVNPDTRLVDVFVGLDKPSDELLLDSFVRGELLGEETDGLKVPRSALVPGGGDDGTTLFTVVDGKAAKHTVKVLAQDDDNAVVSADDLKAGDPAVVTGNLELDDKTAVDASPAVEATSKPAGDDK